MKREKAKSRRRAGYYLGLRVAERLAAYHSLTDMAHWSREQAESKVRAGLDQLGNAGSDSRPN